MLEREVYWQSLSFNDVKEQRKLESVHSRMSNKWEEGSWKAYHGER